MLKENIIALDFGGGKITGVLAVIDGKNQSVKIENAAFVSSKDISGGFVLGIRQAATAVNTLINNLVGENNINCRIICGLRGSYVSLHRAQGFKKIIDCDTRTISQEDVVLATEDSVPSSVREKNYSVISIVPQNYIIDGKEGMKDPVGMSGFMLEVETLVVTAFSSHFDNLNKCLGAAGCDEPVYFPSVFVLGETLLKETEKRMGTLLIDFGAENIGVALYHHGGLVFQKELEFGSNLIDSDIAYMMQNPLETAKEIKEKYKLGDDELLDDVIISRITEFFEKIQNALIESNLYLKMPPVYMVLSGGGAQLNGLVEKAKEFFKIKKVRIASCTDIDISNSGYTDEGYTTTLALIKYYEQTHTAEQFEQETNIINSLREFFKKYLEKYF